MADCECIEGCPFFHDKMDNKPATANLIKKKFCQGTYSECARYKVFKKFGKGSVPFDLFPNMHERAMLMIKG